MNFASRVLSNAYHELLMVQFCFYKCKVKIDNENNLVWFTYFFQSETVCKATPEFCF